MQNNRYTYILHTYRMQNATCLFMYANQTILELGHEVKAEKCWEIIFVFKKSSFFFFLVVPPLGVATAAKSSLVQSNGNGLTFIATLITQSILDWKTNLTVHSYRVLFSTPYLPHIHAQFIIIKSTQAQGEHTNAPQKGNQEHSWFEVTVLTTVLLCRVALHLPVRKTCQMPLKQKKKRFLWSCGRI